MRTHGSSDVMRGRSLRLSLAVMAAIAIVASSPSPGAAAGPCQADLEKLCGKVEPGQGRIRACLEAHKAELSPACKARIQEVKADLADAQEACGDDADKLCDGVQPGQGRVLRCLTEKKSQLTPDCRKKIDEAAAKVEKAKENLQERAEEAQEACKADAAKLCKEVQPGGGRIVKCLKIHDAELTKGCRESLR